MKKIILFLIFMIFSQYLLAESLWQNKNLFHGKAYKVGDSLLVLFNDTSLIEFSTFQANYESSSLNNPNKTTMVLDFLPQLSGDTKNQSKHNAEVKNKNKLHFTIAATIQSITNHLLKIEATHKIKINNQFDTVLLTGLVDPQFIHGGNIESDKINNLTLEYDREIYKSPLIESSDLTNSSGLTNLNLNLTKKKKILLKYFNQVLPLLFKN